jgi:hypothetical protein
MRRKFGLALLVTMLLVAMPKGLSPSIAQGESQRFFPEKGHWVSGEFLKTYESATDPIAIYGYPITDAFLSSTTGLLVQYFEKAYFEFHPENPPELRVVLTLLGEFYYKGGDELRLPQDHPACRYFPDVDHQVCYAFKDFFEANGGVAQFGYPISEIVIEDGRLVQYFSRSCFEWHPELPSGKRVVLANLGIRYFFSKYENPERLLPNKERYIPQSILGLTVRGFVKSAVVAPDETQVLYVIVKDQNLLPIRGAQVMVTIVYPSGDQLSYSIPEPTDEYGITQAPFIVNDHTYGVTEMLLTARYASFEEKTRTSFRIWW